MGRRRYKYFWRRVEKSSIGLILLILGIIIIAFTLLPYSIWLAFLGFAMICIGYKLFI